ncbi:MAG: hypothetical protein R3F56_17810 [Planctomycetota bacterium]
MFETESNISPVGPRSWVLPLALALTLTTHARAQAAPDDSAFLARAATTLAALGIDKEPAKVDFDADVVAPHALVLRVGALELLYPKGHLQKAQQLGDLKDAVLSTCDMQRTFCEWMAGGTVPPEVDTTCKAVQAWIKGWRWPATDEALATVTPEVAKAQADFTGAVAKMLSRDPSQCRAQCWLAPTRQNFGDMVCLIGGLAPENRDFLWLDDVVKSSEGWAVRPRVLQIVAMEYGSPKELGGDTVGMRMDFRERTGLLQHIVQRTAASLAVMAFGDVLDRNFEAGLSQDLVIALYKENNARSGGSGRGGYVGGRSRFVAGGASSGGALGAISLDSQWRQTKGKDWFQRPLKQAQRTGAKLKDAKQPKERMGHFALQDDAGRPILALPAPLLGPPETQPSVPGDFEADFKEMRRAYRSAFVYWLREFAGKGTTDSRQKFGAMMREMAEGAGKVTFDLAVRRAYGERLSADGPEPPSLEWRFLAWLAK